MEKKKDKLVILHNNKSKKIVFVMAFIASAFFSVLLFSSIGTTLLFKFVWSLIGFASVLFQAVKLREYFNSKSKKRYIHLIIYLIVTLVSISGTVGFGISQINNNDNVKEANKRNLTSETIDRYLKENTTMSPWAFIRIIKDKKEIQSKSEGEEQSQVYTALYGLSHVFKTDIIRVSFIFLIVVSIMLEVILYSSVNYKGELFASWVSKSKVTKITRIQKEQRSGQMYLPKIKMNKRGK